MTLLNTLWEPTDDEVREVVMSETAHKAFANGKWFFSNKIIGGQKLRLAFLQGGTETCVEDVTVFCAGSLVDLTNLKNER
jgi:hypothetical protein